MKTYIILLLFITKLSSADVLVLNGQQFNIKNVEIKNNKKLIIIETDPEVICYEKKNTKSLKSDDPFQRLKNDLNNGYKKLETDIKNSAPYNHSHH